MNKTRFTLSVSGLLLAITGVVVAQPYRPNGTPLSVTGVKREYRPDGSLGPQEHFTFSQETLQEITGLTFREYQRAILLTTTIRLMWKRPAFSIKQIAIELGYEHPRDFSRFIKNTTGMTPTELRQAAPDRGTSSIQDNVLKELSYIPYISSILRGDLD